MKFSSGISEQIKAHFLLSQVVGRTVRLRKTGRNYSGLCPFHNEKTPSFSVNDEKGFYHCFGCGAHGDVISFVMNTEGLSYPEAVEKLAGIAGIRIERKSAMTAPQLEQANKQIELLEETASLFERQLNTPGGAKAREYIEKRGLTPELIKAFRIGFAYDSFNVLKNHLLGKNFTIEDAKITGVMSASESGEVFDRFRGRLIFPITNSKSKVIGFGGRVLDNSMPKYLNSPETPMFKKSEMLYGLDQARKEIYKSGKAIVVEGYLDVIALHQLGFTNAVAPMGTALTRNHLELLWRLTRDIVVCLDGDQAGQNAMMRTAETAIDCIMPGYEVHFAKLPKGYDPDIFIRELGPEQFDKCLKRAVNLAEALWQKHAEMAESGVPGKRAEAEKELNLLSERIKDPLLKKHFQSFFAGRMWQAGREKVKHLGKQEKNFNPGFTQDSETLMAAAMFTIIKKFPELVEFAETEAAISSLSFTVKVLEALRIKLEEAMYAHNLNGIGNMKFNFDAGAQKYAEALLNQAQTPIKAREILTRLLEDLNKVIAEKNRQNQLSCFEGDVTEEEWEKFLALHSSIPG